MSEVPWRRVTGLRNVLIHGYRTWTSKQCGGPSRMRCRHF
ncbi:MAG TPA: HepT-like ribonuclease domain-containing protein [Actinomycetota bacterium]|nr:HepT-like ribonuclease domain-containing protein [Actinomycetota bacterium]